VFLESRYASCLTHLSLGVLTIAYFALLILVPFWIAFLPGVVIAHRIGVLLHEYLHGIPLRRYRYNHAVVTLFDGLMLMFGLLELFRGTHLAHHRWLNTDLDPAKETAGRTGGRRLVDLLAVLEAIQFLIYFRDALAGRKPYVRRGRLLLGAILSVATILVWIQAGHPEVAWKTFAIMVFTMLVPVSLRGAIEHHSHSGDPEFANEYKVWIPLFNLNRHIHHHEEPSVPWYLLKFRTERPLSRWNYFTRWFRVYVKRDFVLMQPMSGAAVKSSHDGQKTPAA